MTDGPHKTVFPLVAGVLMIGAVVGVGLGLLIDDAPEPVAEKHSNIPKEPTPEPVISLSVRVDRSERALSALQYEDVANVPPVVDETIIPGDAEEDVVEADPSDPLLALVKPDEGVITPNVTHASPEQETVASVPADITPAAPAESYAKPVPIWEKRALPVSGLLGERRPLLAVVIDDVGIDQRRTAQAIELPGPMTFSFIPYGRNLSQFVDTASKNGHEIMLHMPMEPENENVDPGPNALLTSLDEAEIAKRLNWGLSQFNGYIGLNNHMGSKFTAWVPGMRIVLEELRNRDLMFMDSITSPQSVGYKLAREMGVAVTIRDVFLDHDQDEKAIRAQLGRMEKIARENGHAIAIGHPHDSTLAVLGDWVEGVEERGYRLVPVSAILLKKRAVQVSRQESQG
ncbi:divergent polysaccharide deacetylase family protein [Aestuariispira insulae]|uniref:Divergent polysaccharide deacetylase family protein n=1 Tax=Aestuariispira insulae TaxID=1461337 RepID=A0A3D9HUY6_9PROT|nr:divergent polysaccharide deacetylase family protein [Aestuariispira insulae]RED53277.1 hypothetical protein DFP90_10159 [Aestuariispira insulae]